MTRSSPATAIILGARFPALGVIASLAQRGIPCVVCDSKRMQAAFSRHAKFRRIPDPRTDPEASAQTLVEISRELATNGRPVLIPTDDHHTRLLAHHAETLSEVAVLCAPRQNTADLLTDQLRFCEWALDQSINVPHSAPADTPDLPFDFPVIVKPLNYSGFLATTPDFPAGIRHSDLRFTRINDQAEWASFQKDHAATLSHLVVQEYISGNSADMYSIGIYADRSAEVRGVFVGRKLRGFPAAYGNTMLGQNDCVPDSLLDEVRWIVAKLEIYGISEFEYLRDPISGQFWLIEINPRCWSWILATKYSDADIPLMAYRDLTGQKVRTAIVNENPGQIKAVRAIPDLVNVLWRYRSDAPEWLMSPSDWWSSLSAPHRVIVETEGRDPLVTLYCTALALRDLIKNEK